jgi:catechol 2,3-dioxygenase-like lactoylglutathione lyase family enzyme
MTAGPDTSIVERRSPQAAAAPRPSPIKVKKLGHLVYEVSDVERSRKFWTEVMGFTVSDVNEQGMCFLRTNADHHGIGLKPGKKARRPEASAGLQVEHLALEVENIDALFAARSYLKEQGIPVVWEGRKGAGGNFGVTFLDPDGYQFELYCGMDQIDASGRTRPASQFFRADSLEVAVANPLPKTW